MSRLSFRQSAMAAGKSIALLQVAHNYEAIGGKVLLFTSQLDDRYGVGKITSRLGPISRDAETYTADFNFLEQLQDRVDGVSCILVDEAQFMTKDQVEQLHIIAQCWDVPVIAFGLRSDSNGKPFEGSASLMALAEDIEELRTVCQCGKRATMNMRIDSDGHMVVGGAQVVIGGNTSYRSVCGRCFYMTRNPQLKLPSKAA